MPASYEVMTNAELQPMLNIAISLNDWRHTQLPPCGQTLAGDDLRLVLPCDNPIPFIIDVAYIFPTVRVEMLEKRTTINGIPVLVVKEMKPSETYGVIHELVATCNTCKVPLLWVFHSHQKTVTIYRPGQRPTLVNADENLTGGMVLPGFDVPVARLFE